MYVGTGLVTLSLYLLPSATQSMDKLCMTGVLAELALVAATSSLAAARPTRELGRRRRCLCVLFFSLTILHCSVFNVACYIIISQIFS